MISNAANTLPPIKMYQNYSQFSTRFSTLGENWLLNILHGIWTFKHNYGSPIKLLLRRTKIVFPPEFSNVQKNCYDGDGIKIPRARYIFWKFAENWGKFRQRLTFQLLVSHPQHYGTRRLSDVLSINSDIFWRLNFLLLKTPSAARKGISLEWY